jgi:lactoylglutathione lyase
MQLSLVVIRVGCADRAIPFYQTLGFQFTKHAHGNGPEHYTSETAGLVFEIYPLTPGQTPTTSVRIGFRVADVDQLVRQLAAIGAPIVTPAQDSPWGRRAVVKDFDGHTVELSSENI